MSVPLSAMISHRNTDAMDLGRCLPLTAKMSAVTIGIRLLAHFYNSLRQNPYGQKTCNARNLAIAVIEERFIPNIHSFHEVLCLMVPLILFTPIWLRTTPSQGDILHLDCLQPRRDDIVEPKGK